ncbi:MAG: ABC transporter permease [Christensenellales bacterium]
MDRIRKLFRNDLTSVLLPLIILLVVLISSSPGFLSAYNMLSVFQSVAIFVLIGLAQMSALALGQFNLAVGAMGSLSAVLMGLFMQELGIPVLIAVFMGLLIAMALGGIQGVLIAKSGLSPFIITLALLSVYTGIATVITKGNSYSRLPEFIKDVGRAQIGAVPVTFIIALIICALAFILFNYTNIGKRLQAVGANQRSARFSGINVDMNIILGHALSGLFCGFAAFIQICRFNSAQLAIGSDWMMTSFVVAVLGGTLLSGGKASVIGTLLGSLLMVFINNALGLWRVNTYAFQAIMGVVLLIAYEVDRARVALVKRQTLLAAEAAQKGDNRHE